MDVYIKENHHLCESTSSKILLPPGLAFPANKAKPHGSTSGTSLSEYTQSIIDCNSAVSQKQVNLGYKKV